MNKQELIERIECLKNIFGNRNEYVKIDFVVELISGLDEPKKVTIPQFVADVIEGAREESAELEQAFQFAWWNGTDEFTEWYKKKSNRDVFARAWLDGYEVEKEKRYLVKIKNIDTNSAYLKHQLQNNHWYWGSLTECGAFSPYHTKKELEAAGFCWVFDCEGVEIEELEDE